MSEEFKACALFTVLLICIIVPVIIFTPSSKPPTLRPRVTPSEIVNKSGRAVGTGVREFTKGFVKGVTGR